MRRIPGEGGVSPQGDGRVGCEDDEDREEENRPRFQDEPAQQVDDHRKQRRKEDLNRNLRLAWTLVDFRAGIKRNQVRGGRQNLGSEHTIGVFGSASAKAWWVYTQDSLERRKSGRILSVGGENNVRCMPRRRRRNTAVSEMIEITAR